MVSSAAGDDVLREKGGLQLAVRCMEAHPGSELIQRDGCLIMARISRHWDVMNGVDGVNRVVQACQLYPQSAGVNQAAIGALVASTIASPSAKPAVCRAGGVLVATNALNTHPTREKLQYDACMLLSILCHNNPDAKKDAQKIDTSGALVDSLRSNIYSERVLVQGLQVMHILVYQSLEGRDTACRAGGENCIEEILTEWAEKPQRRSRELEILAKNVLAILQGTDGVMKSIAESPHEETAFDRGHPTARSRTMAVFGTQAPLSPPHSPSQISTLETTGDELAELVTREPPKPPKAEKMLLEEGERKAQEYTKRSHMKNTGPSVEDLRRRRAEKLGKPYVPKGESAEMDATSITESLQALLPETPLSPPKEISKAEKARQAMMRSQEELCSGGYDSAKYGNEEKVSKWTSLKAIHQANLVTSHNAAVVDRAKTDGDVSNAAYVVRMIQEEGDRDVEIGCRELAELAKENPGVVQRAGGIPVLLDTIKSATMGSKVRLLHWAMSALARTCNNINGRVEAVSKGAAPIVVSAMKVDSHDRDLAAAGCHVLTLLPVECNIGLSAVVSAGGIDVGLRAMKRHQEDVAVQCYGCSLVANACYGGHDAKEVRDKIVNLEAGSWVITALKRWIGEVVLCREACKALCNLALHSRTTRRKMGFKGGGVVAVLNAISAHPEEELWAEGCIALSHLCHGEFKCKSAAAPTAPGILTGIVKNALGVGVQLSAICAMHTLLTDQKKGKEDTHERTEEDMLSGPAFVRAGAIRAVELAMERQGAKNDPDMKRWGSNVVAILYRTMRQSHGKIMPPMSELSSDQIDEAHAAAGDRDPNKIPESAGFNGMSMAAKLGKKWRGAEIPTTEVLVSDMLEAMKEVPFKPRKVRDACIEIFNFYEDVTKIASFRRLEYQDIEPPTNGQAQTYMEALFKAADWSGADESLVVSALTTVAAMSADHVDVLNLISGTKRTIDLMDQWWKAGPIQHYGCAVICNSTFENREGQALLLDHGGLQVVLRAMSSHPNNAGVVHAGCGVLCNLAQDPLKRRILTEAGAIPCIQSGMWAFTGPDGMKHPEVQEWGLNTLIQCCTRNPTGIAILVKMDPNLDLVQQAQQFHWQNPVIISACHRLQTLFDSSKPKGSAMS